MPRLEEHVRHQAIGMIAGGIAKREVARRLGCHVSTICRLQTRYQPSGSVSDRPRPGRQRVTTPRQDIRMRVLHLRNRFLTASETARHTIGIHGRRIHVNTVRSRLRAAGLKARRPVKAAILTLRHKQDRLRWARAKLRFTRRQWGSVLFSDESRIKLSRADGRKRVWRRRHERYANACVLEHNVWGGGTLHFWAGITQFEKTRLVIFDRNVTARTYIDDVLRPVVVPFLQRHGRRSPRILQHDNARPHTAQVTRRCLAANNIDVLPWPALSPDMSPIEHVWDELKRRVYQRANPPTNLQELRQALQEEWQRLPQHVIASKVLSMRRRCQSLVNAYGGHTRY